MKRIRININGQVQGVGFRPTVYRYAKDNSLAGWVTNTSQGVLIEVEGKQDNIDEFVQQLKEHPPAQARIDEIDIAAVELKKESDFKILPSIANSEIDTQISPDIATCPDCVQELFDSKDRRWEYPFLNCTNCGPRFSIMKNIPYDRSNTTMAEFEMCCLCQNEYDEVTNRRFHAQPNACSDCGPEVELVASRSSLVACKNKEAIGKAIELLGQGKIVAVKGLGGFHLVCDANNEKAVADLRERKYREDKPFAVMAKDIAVVKEYCYFSSQEEELLQSTRRPIVLLRKRDDCAIAASVAPGNKHLGFMIPYTPLHHLLFGEKIKVLVMTSGNVSDEPIAYKNEDAFNRLEEIVDCFLFHNRDVHIRCDDSVTRILPLVTVANKQAEYIIRRSRGYVPQPIIIPVTIKKEILACGGHLKNTFALAKGNKVYLSHHIGDLENWETLNAFENGITHFQNVFQIKPKIVVHDLHPEYLSTKYAAKLCTQDKTLQFIGVQHHHAHIASCMADNGLTDRKVIGVAFDGTGYGSDNAIWGGEILLADYSSYKRVAHLEYLPLPGGDQAIKEPWRMAAMYLYNTYGDDFTKLNISFLDRFDKQQGQVIKQMADRRINSPLTSSIGRLFAAVSSLIGVRDNINYEGQAACELEMLITGKANGSYEYQLDLKEGMYIIKPQGIIKGIVADLKEHVKPEVIAYKFHITIVKLIVALCLLLREDTGLCEAALSGGVFQNMFLLEHTYKELVGNNFKVYIHNQVPTNDGGLSLGQTMIASARL